MMNDQTPIDDADATPVNYSNHSIDPAYAPIPPDRRPGFDPQATHAAIGSLNFAIAPPQPTPIAFLQSVLAWNQDWLQADTSAADEAHAAIRNYLDQPEALLDLDCERLLASPNGRYILASIRTALIALNTNEYQRDELSHLAMQLSLCPMHFCDWASCFDDDDQECAQIRAIFPYGHDT